MMKPTTIYRDRENITLELPDHLADWDVWDYWEHERYASIVERMAATTGTLWEIGAEHGAQAALYAERLGGDRLVLVEPSYEFWPNIRMIWEANDFRDPAACVLALVGAEASIEDGTARRGCVSPRGAWPVEAMATDVECPAMPYKYLHKGDGEAIVTTTIDELGDDPNVPPPDGISIDIEGAELLALRGSHLMLSEMRPLWWISVHPDLLERDYGGDRDELLDLMGSYGYSAQLLAVDHEEHWLFVPLDR